jgi:hypothetical protein
MDKSVYSLVLSDRIIEAADAWAAPRNLSRSAAVNRILAEYLSTTTPEQRVQDVVRQVETLLDDSLLMPTLADGLLAMRTPVRFKYNPFVRCVAEVKGSEWELRASARTQSASLIEALDAFFLAFCRVMDLTGQQARIENGRLTVRQAISCTDCDAAAQEIAGWLTRLQNGMKAYFSCYPDTAAAQAALFRAIRE